MKRSNHSEIADFLETCIVPLYDGFDAGHQRDHAHAVMRTSHKLAQYYPEVDETMLLVAAAYPMWAWQRGVSTTTPTVPSLCVPTSVCANGSPPTKSISWQMPPRTIALRANMRHAPSMGVLWQSPTAKSFPKR